jgi:ribonuclease VapC
MKVIDASAVLTLLLNEPGAETVVSHLLEDDVVIGSVNYAEVFTRLYDCGSSVADAQLAWQQLSLPVMPLQPKTALAAAGLRASTKKLGLSLGDRCCLALAQELNATVITADRPWAKLPGFDVALVR